MQSESESKIVNSLKKRDRKSKFLRKTSLDDSPKDDSTKGESDPEIDPEESETPRQAQEKQILKMTLHLVRSRGESSGCFRKLAMLNAALEARNPDSKLAEDPVTPGASRKRTMAESGLYEDDSLGELAVVAKRSKPELS